VPTRSSLPASTPPRVPVEERLFSLVLALLATEAGLTKNEILSSVQGYRQRYVSSGDNSSLERQFERDKDDIRELGVPLETVESPGDAGNNQTLRYRIPKGSYDLPSDIVFSAEEITLLGLAATVWREGSLSAESRRAIMKLRSLGVETNEPIVGYAPQLRVRESSFEPLSLALERKTVVTFPYLKPGETSSRIRTVEPLALVQHQGRWHLQGTDRDAHGPRTFLLSRIVGEVILTNRTFELEGTDFAARALDELERIWLSNQAEIEVEANSDAATRMNNRYGEQGPANTHLSVHYSDINILADELASYGPEVFVLSPPELKAAVLARLTRTVRDHSGEVDSTDEGVDHG
jgi:proteasome accessory factor B